MAKMALWAAAISEVVWVMFSPKLSLANADLSVVASSRTTSAT
jgi:hypothetical protein